MLKFLMRLSKNTKRLIIFFLLSTVSITLILYFTTNEKTYEIIFNYNPLFLLFCLILWLLALIIDTIGFLFFIKGADEKIRIWDSFRISIIRVFFNLITPFTFGGQPFIVYMLSKIGIPSGKGSTIVITRLLSLSFFTMAGVIVSLILFKDTIKHNGIVIHLFLGTVILFIIFFILLILVMLFPPIMKTVMGIIGNIGKRFLIIKDLNSFNQKAIREINNMRDSFVNYFRKHFLFFLSGFLCTGILHLINIIIIFAIISSFGISFDLKAGIMACFLLFFCISYMPTPGSSGLGEGIFVLIFQGIVPNYCIGIVIILWRIFYQYLTALLGAIFSARFFSKVIISDKTSGNLIPEDE